MEALEIVHAEFGQKFGLFRRTHPFRHSLEAEILRQIRRKSLARLRREVEPVEQHTLARFLTHWQGLLAPRRWAVLVAVPATSVSWPQVNSAISVRWLPRSASAPEPGSPR